MAGFHITALARRVIAEDDTRQALLRLAEEMARSDNSRTALLFDFSGIPEITNRLFFRAITRFVEERTSERRHPATPIAKNCVVLITDPDNARKILSEMRKLSSFLRYRRHGTFQVTCFDLRREHRQFGETCRKLMEQRPVPPPDRSLCLKEEAPPSIEALDQLISIGRTFGQADISMLLRNQDIWFFPPDASPVTIGREFWLSVNAIESLLHIRIGRDPWLFDRMTQYADHRVLNYMQHVSRPFPLPYNINLHLATIFTGDFRRFVTSLNTARSKQLTGMKRRPEVIVELSAEECRQYPDAFAAAVEILEDQEIGLAIDRMEWKDLETLPETITQHAAYLKLLWLSVAAQMTAIAGTEDAETMITTLERVGSNKIVLIRCDHSDVVERGLRLGIRRFQGRGINRFLLNAETVERVLGPTAAMSVIKAQTGRLRAEHRHPEYSM
jgi:hypothetical protein